MPDSNNDKVLADAIRRFAEEFNSVVERARKEGLAVEYISRQVEGIDITIEFTALIKGE